MRSSFRRAFHPYGVVCLLLIGCATQAGRTDAGSPDDGGTDDGGVDGGDGAFDAGRVEDAGQPQDGGDCSPNNSACVGDADCCSGTCRGRVCGPPCGVLYSGCDQYDPCCGGYLCGAPGQCLGSVGNQCQEQPDCWNGDCVNGYCSADGGTDPCALANGGCDPAAVCTLASDMITCTCAAGVPGDGLVCLSGEPPEPLPSSCGGVPPVVQPDADAGMVIVPAGPFWRGCNDSVDTLCVADEYPGACITLSAYEIDQTEASEGAYQACISAGACTAPTPCGGSFTPVETPDAPVVCVSWDQAVAFCTWGGKRLPTEAEWEKASRGVDGRVYPWGNQNPDSVDDPCALVIDDLCPPRPVPVASDPAGMSPYGALQMSGNVWEWVSDWYDPDYYAAAPPTDPQGPSMNPPSVIDSGAFHVYRGGGITDPTTFQRSSNRYGGPPGIYFNLGIRCARSISSP